MDEQIYTIIARTLTGEATEADREELDAWLARDGKHAAEYEELKAVWSGADVLFATPKFNAGSAWEKVSTRIRPEAPARPATRTFRLPAWTKYTMAAAAVLLIGLFAVRFYNSDRITVVADNGIREVSLPDGSRITLREGSRLTYPEQFDDKERHVTLKGEAFFDVARNERQPFTIDARSVNVRVLGTSFNVACSSKGASVMVVSGKVEMSAGRKKVVLTKGQSGILANGKLVSAIAPSENYLYWKSGTLKFTNEPLSKVVEEIGKAARVRVTLDPALPAEVRDQLVTVSFSRQPVEEMLNELCLITHTQLVKAGKGYTIRAKQS